MFEPCTAHHFTWSMRRNFHRLRRFRLPDRPFDSDEWIPAFAGMTAPKGRCRRIFARASAKPAKKMARPEIP